LQDDLYIDADPRLPWPGLEQEPALVSLES
jgi:hypothetical protein